MNSSHAYNLYTESSTEVLFDSHNLHSSEKISIVAGHYCVADELSDLSNEADSEVNSFEYGIELYKSLKTYNKKAELILFINDIGIDKETRKALVDNYTIPDNYLSTLESNNIDLQDVKIVFESSMRNKASKDIRKIKKSSVDKFEILSSTDKRLVRCIDPAAACEIPQHDKQAITIKGPDGEYLVVKEGTNPKCNTILATLFNRLIEQNESDTIINCFNVIYTNRIRLGAYVSHNLFETNVNFINLFFDETGLLA